MNKYILFNISLLLVIASPNIVNAQENYTDLAQTSSTIVKERSWQDICDDHLTLFSALQS